MDLTDARYYRARNGNMLVIGRSWIQLLFSRDGKKFYELSFLSEAAGELTFVNPHDRVNGTIDISKGEKLVILGGSRGKEFVRCESVEVTKVVPLPHQRVPWHLYKNRADGTMIYLSRERFHTGNNRLFIGKPPRLDLVKEFDGSMQKIETSKGILYSDDPPVLDGDPLVEQDPLHYNIAESKKIVTIK